MVNTEDLKSSDESLVGSSPIPGTTPTKETTLGFEPNTSGINRWYNYDTCTYERVQELIPTDWPLNFHLDFILEVANNPALDCLGVYTNGWEL